MDKEAAELSKAGLALFSKELSPDYRRVRELLLGHLAAQGASFEQLAKKEVNDRKNIELLTSFTGLLPQAEFARNSWSFHIKDPYELKIIQSNTVWSNEIAGTRDLVLNSVTFSWRPYYLIGRSINSGPEKWLVVGSGENDDRKSSWTYDNLGTIFEFLPNWRTRRNALHRLQKIASSEYPSPDDMTRLFSLDHRHLIVDGDSPGSVRVKGEGLYHPHKRNRDRISDNELGMYDVHSYLHRIATAFRIEDKLHELFSKYTV